MSKNIRRGIYDAGDTELTKMHLHTRAIMQEHNITVYDKRHREKLLQKKLGKIGKRCSERDICQYRGGWQSMQGHKASITIDFKLYPS